MSSLFGLLKKNSDLTYLFAWMVIYKFNINGVFSELIPSNNINIF